MGQQCLSTGKNLLVVTTHPSVRTAPCQPAQALCQAPVPTSPSTSRSSSSSDRKHRDSMEEGLPMRMRPSAQWRGRTLVPLSTILSPGANRESATIPFASSMGTASLRASTSPSAGAGYGSSSPCCTGAPVCSLTPPKSHEATESTSDGEYTHLDPPAAGWAKREREGRERG